MKSSKKLVVLFSVLVVSSFLFGTVVSAVSEKNPFNQIWEAIFDLQSQVDEIEASSGLTRIVYDISIDLEEDGDIIDSYYSDLFGWTDETHYKRIEIPEIELDDLPISQLYTYSTEPIDGKSILLPDATFRVDEGCILIYYKFVRIPDENPEEITTSYFPSEYTLVVVK